MKKILRLILITIFVLISHNQIWDNLIFQNNVATLIKVAVILSIFELLIKPVIKLLLLPINILTLGLIRLVINTLGLYLAVFLLNDFQVNEILTQPSNLYGLIIPQLHFQGFFAFLISALTINLIAQIYSKILSKKVKK